MNIETLKNFVKKHLTPLLIAVVLLVFALVAVAILSLTREEEETEAPTPVSAPTVSSTKRELPSTITVEIPQLPSGELNVFAYEPAFGGELTPEQGTQLAGFFGLEGEPRILNDTVSGEIYLWAIGAARLTINEDASAIIFNYDLELEPSVLVGILPSAKDAESIVRSFIPKLDPQSGLDLLLSKTSLLRTGGAKAGEAPTTEQAEVIKLSFLTKIGEYNLVNESGVDSPVAVVWIGPEGKILKLIYRPPGSAGESLGRYPIKTAGEIESALQAGEGTLTEIGSGGYENEGLERSIVSMIIHQAEVAYFQPRTQREALQPFFVLTGAAALEGGSSVPVTIYLPAIKSGYLK